MKELERRALMAALKPPKVKKPDEALAAATATIDETRKSKAIDVERQNPDYRLSRLLAKLKDKERQYIAEIRGKFRPEKIKTLSDIIYRTKQLIQNIVARFPELRDGPIDEAMLPPKPTGNSKIRVRHNWRLIRANRKGGRKAVPRPGLKVWGRK